MQTHRALILRIISKIMVVALAAAIVWYMRGTAAADRSVQELTATILPVFANDRSEESPERVFKKVFGYNAADFDGVVLYSPISNMDAEELLIARCTDEEQAEALEAAAGERVRSQMNIFEGYAPEQFYLCQNAVVDRQGQYLLYVVHADADAIDTIFRNALK